jgi:predicted NAD/FAD-binding protein/cyclopropane fatty-acyl-phospholipid synthase-like methyltransferase
MSFSVSMRKRTMEWASDLAGLFATPQNALSPAFWQMLRDIVRFNIEAPKHLEDPSAGSVTLGEFLERGGYSTAFSDYYLFPMIACVWSATAEDVMAFPASTLIRFFVNHHLVSADKPQWRTVSGRSREYIRAISKRFHTRLFLNSPVASIKRTAKATPVETPVRSTVDCTVTLKDGSSHTFDHVVFACHPDQALAILGDQATEAERRVLKEFHYDDNVAYLHRDEALMPQRKKCWASWNFIGYGTLDESSIASAKAEAREACCITYWLNRLQNFGSATRGDIFVTLNPPSPPAEDKIIQTFQYAHPQFTLKSIAAQAALDKELQGTNCTWFAGAYLGYGFHEDGLTSGLRVAYRLSGVPAPWWKEAAAAEAPLCREAFTPDKWDSLEAADGYLLATEEDLSNLAVYGVHCSGDSRADEGTTVGFSSLDDDVDGSSDGEAPRPVSTSNTVTAKPMILPDHKEGSRVEAGQLTRLIPFGKDGLPVVWTDPWGRGSRGGGAIHSVGAAASRMSFGDFSDARAEDIPGTIRFYRSREWLDVTGMPRLSDSRAGLGGGYTVHADPVKRPTREAASCCSLSGLWSTASSVASWAASYPVLDIFRRGMQLGCVVIREPSGHSHLFGDALAPSHLRAEMHVHDASFFLRSAIEADLGIAREYMAGHWSCDDLAALFHIFIINRDRDDSVFKSSKLWTASVGRLLNFMSFRLFLDNSIAGSRANIHSHYDLSSGLFETFLDPTTMAYSCARFRTKGVDPSTGKPRFVGSLDDAQTRKLDALISLARVNSEHKVLDLGFGWGGLSIRLAQTTGCTVHGITLSKEQLRWSQRRVKALGLEDRVTFELVDYREFAALHEREFDRIISVEMIEAVGHNYLGTFMGACSSLLKPDGIFVMQAITLHEPRYDEYVHSVDFINTVIFPGGQCPCVSSLLSAMHKSSDMVLSYTDNHALHYAETLRVWRRNFNAHLPRVKALGFDDTFIRTWNYYLAYCEAGFQSETLGLHTLVFSKPKAPQSA